MTSQKVLTPDKEGVKPILKFGSNIEVDIDKLITYLFKGLCSKERNKEISEAHVLAVTYTSQQIFKKENSLLILDSPLKVCGDIHGQYCDLLRLFKLCGKPPETQYLFLGDYVDRGLWSLEVMMLLLAYKIKYPTKFHMLRGNHESEITNRIYGFREEIRNRYKSSRCWRAMLSVFAYLPVAAIIEGRIFCCHGGLSPELMNTEHTDIECVINQIKRPTAVPSFGILCDLLWSDPLDLMPNGDQPTGWLANDRGCSWAFGIDVVIEFLEKYNLDLIVRAHQVVEDGYEFAFDRRLVTIFSAPNYMGSFDNAGGIFCVTKVKLNENDWNLRGTFQVLLPDYSVNQWPDKEIKKKKKKSKKKTKKKDNKEEKSDTEINEEAKEKLNDDKESDKVNKDDTNQ